VRRTAATPPQLITSAGRGPYKVPIGCVSELTSFGCQAWDPRIALSGDDVVCAWTEGAQSVSRVQTAVARLPVTAR
jgi:hypothetical protein